MKTIIYFGFLLATILLSQFSYATGNLSVNLVSKTESKAVLEVTNKSDQNSEISISSSNGEMVYFLESDEVQNNFSKTFDFSKLEDGDYTI